MALKKYDLEIVESAEKDINDICSYLADTFENPQAAHTFLLEFSRKMYLVCGIRPIYSNVWTKNPIFLLISESFA